MVFRRVSGGYFFATLLVLQSRSSAGHDYLAKSPLFCYKQQWLPLAPLACAQSYPAVDINPTPKRSGSFESSESVTRSVRKYARAKTADLKWGNYPFYCGEKQSERSTILRGGKTFLLSEWLVHSVSGAGLPWATEWFVGAQPRPHSLIAGRENRSWVERKEPALLLSPQCQSVCAVITAVAQWQRAVVRLARTIRP